MDKFLVYKTSDNAICVCEPHAKKVNQKQFSSMSINNMDSRNSYIQNEATAIAYERNRKNERAVAILQKKIAWANRVVDFDNITDEEYQDFIHCSMPDDKQYHHWIDKKHLPDKEFMEAWVDIDADGKVVHDIAKVKEISINRIIDKLTRVMDRQKLEASMGGDTAKLDDEIAALKVNYIRVQSTDVSDTDVGGEKDAAIIASIKSISGGK